MEVKRIKFSQFDETAPENVQFVGWKVDDDGNKKNVQVDYTKIQSDIERIVNSKLDDPNATEVRCYKLFDETEKPHFNTNEETHVINLKERKGFIEINGGGSYNEEYVYLENPRIGSVTTIVVDNTGDDDGTKPEGDFVLYYGLKKSG